MRLAAGLRWGSYSAPRPLSCYKGDGREGTGRKGLRLGRGESGGKGKTCREGWKGEGRIRGMEGPEGKERVGLDLDICQGAA